MDDRDFRISRNWIRKTIKHGKKKSRYNSYRLKHVLERATGVYLSNSEFKLLMLMCGFAPVDASRLNWVYEIDDDVLNSSKKGV